jgi:hypothetical protein
MLQNVLPLFLYAGAAAAPVFALFGKSMQSPLYLFPLYGIMSCAKISRIFQHRREETMEPWLVILLVTAGVVFGIDYVCRRKKWKDNSKLEKISLLVHMLSVTPYMLLSVLGYFWGLAASSPKTVFGERLDQVTLVMGQFFAVPAIAAVILSFVFRKLGKTKASIWVHVIALSYIIVVLGVNILAGALL